MKILLLFLSLTSYAQVWEKMPKVDDQHYAVFTYKVKSYVQLPGDSIEYQTLGIYVQIREKVGREVKCPRYYLGDYLKPTGRKCKVVSEAVKNEELTMMDKMLNRENNFER